MEKFRLIETKYDTSRCFICKEHLPKGTKVWWRKGSSIRCGDCTPNEDRFASSSPFDQARRSARTRKQEFLRLFEWKYQTPNEEVKSLLDLLERATEPEDINASIDQIIDVAVPVRLRATS